MAEWGSSFILQKADTKKTHGKPALDAEEFVRFYHMLTERPELDEIFMRYDDGKGYWSFSDLCKFFFHEQKVPHVNLVAEDKRDIENVSY